MDGIQKNASCKSSKGRKEKERRKEKESRKEKERRKEGRKKGKRKEGGKKGKGKESRKKGGKKEEKRWKESKKGRKGQEKGRSKKAQAKKKCNKRGIQCKAGTAANNGSASRTEKESNWRHAERDASGKFKAVFTPKTQWFATNDISSNVQGAIINETNSVVINPILNAVKYFGAQISRFAYQMEKTLWNDLKTKTPADFSVSELNNFVEEKTKEEKEKEEKEKEKEKKEKEEEDLKKE